jgi:hypothetical protein
MCCRHQFSKNIVTKKFIVEKGFENTPNAIIYSNKSSIAKAPISGPKSFFDSNLFLIGV